MYRYYSSSNNNASQNSSVKQDEINNSLGHRVISKHISMVLVQHVQCSQHAKVKNDMYVCMYVCDIFI